ncbi:MAG: polysaccharide deacetylase family protein [Candidatus Saccharibacteria bacterium]|nr:polysaccharide deacetylase family protein [Candidatus Saccharibacteria bacterium]
MLRYGRSYFHKHSDKLFLVACIVLLMVGVAGLTWGVLAIRNLTQAMVPRVSLTNNLAISTMIDELPAPKTEQPVPPRRSQSPTTPTKPVTPVTGRVVYLTFDDGPSAITGDVLDALDRYGVKATFFVTGNGQNYNGYIKTAQARGHAIGLHTYTHNYGLVYQSDQAYFDDLGRISAMVNDLTGQQSKLVRFPGGSSNTISRHYSNGIMSRLATEVRRQGYQYFDWNCSSGDADGNNVPVDKLVANASCPYEQVVLLMHDAKGKQTTAEALPQIIEYYRARGYAFESLNTASYAAHHRINN